MMQSCGSGAEVVGISKDFDKIVDDEIGNLLTDSFEKITNSNLPNFKLSSSELKESFITILKQEVKDKVRQFNDEIMKEKMIKK